jgi:hypothetical protein
VPVGARRGGGEVGAGQVGEIPAGWEDTAIEPTAFVVELPAGVGRHVAALHALLN